MLRPGGSWDRFANAIEKGRVRAPSSSHQEVVTWRRGKRKKRGGYKRIKVRKPKR